MTRIQFIAIELARNRRGFNTCHYEKKSTTVKDGGTSKSEDKKETVEEGGQQDDTGLNKNEEDSGIESVPS